jgi:putative membrane protein
MNQSRMDTSNNNMDTSNRMGTTMPADAKTTSFLKDAAEGGMAEVQLGQLAQDKGNSQRVKDFGSMMVRDHSSANDQVKQLASQRSVSLSDSISSQHKKAKDDLSKKDGKAFDKAYIDAMVKGHQQVIDMFEKASKNVTDAQVKSFIDNTLPTIKMHLDSAKAIQKSIR